ncbi:MAG: GatB/YqeY domain-containing protein [Bacteroidota bacterium]
MSLSEQITTDMKAAMKSGEKLKLETLRSLRAHFIELSKRGGDRPVGPDDELSVLTTAIKRRREAIELYRQGGREELARQEELELEIIQSYLPKQLTPEEIETGIDRIVRETGSSSPKDFGKVMGMAMKEFKGKSDGAMIQQLVRKKLGG